MGFSKDEVLIRLGMDSTALKSGIEKASSYLDQWRNKQTSEEKEYTSFWKSELAKRDALEIESITRSNRARKLRRERADRRDEAAQAEMMPKSAMPDLPKSIGLETAALGALGKKAVSVLKANVFLAIAELIWNLIPTAEEFWNKIYGVDEASMAKQQQARDNIKKVAAELKKARADLEAGTAANVLENATPERRAKMLEDAYFSKQKQVADAKNKASELAYDLEFTKGTLAVEARNEIDLKYAAALKDVIALQMEQLAVEKALKSAREAMWSAAPPVLKHEPLPAGVSPQAYVNSTQPFMPFMPRNANNHDFVVKAFSDALKSNTLRVLIEGVKEP